MKDKYTKETLIIDNSLYRKTTHTEYLGEINLMSIREKLDKKDQLITELDGLSSNYVNKSNLLTVSKIEGVRFLAGAKPAENMDDYYKPVLGTRANQANGFPLYEFVTTPPDGRNMYTFIHWRSGRISQMYIAISAKYTNSDSFVLHRAPIPNCAFPDGHMCLGSLSETRTFQPDKVHKMIKDMMTSGWNQDWHRNEVYFVEKSSTQMQIRWHKPMTQIKECVQLSNPDLLSIVNKIEKENNKYNKLKTIQLFHDNDNYEQIIKNRNNQQEDQGAETTNDQTSETAIEDPIVLERAEHNAEERVETTANQVEQETTPRVIDLRTPQLS